MERGYVKLWRKTLDSGVVSSPSVSSLFLWLLLNATHKPRQIFYGGVVFDLKAGDALYGRTIVSQKLGLSERQIRTALNVLQKLGIVTIKSTNKCSIISLVNWDRYQGERPANVQQDDQQATSKRPASDQQATTEQECKECKNEEINNTFVPPSMEEVSSYCSEKGYDIDAESFVDFYASKGWKVGKSPMKDWKRAITTWRKNNRTKNSGDTCPFECPYDAIQEVWDNIFPERKSYGWTQETRNNLARTWRERYADRQKDVSKQWKTVDDGIRYFHDAWRFVLQYCEYGLWKKRDGSYFMPSFDWAVCSENFISMLNVARERRQAA